MSNTITIKADDLHEVAESLRKNNDTQIKKAKIKNDLFLQASYTEQFGEEINEFDRSSNMPIHPDLRAAFKNIDPHMRSVCEQGEDSATYCTGIIIAKDGEGVQLIGHRDLAEGGMLNLVSPIIQFGGEYASSDQGQGFRKAVEAVQNEVMEYLFHGKFAPKAQMELFPEDEKKDDDLPM